MFRWFSPVFVGFVCVITLNAQLAPKPDAEYPVAFHEHLNDSCELIHRATLLIYKQYVALSVAGEADEVYSAELGRGDFLTVSPALKKQVTKAARKSRYEVHIDSTAGDIPAVAETSGSACPTVEQAIISTERERYKRGREMQSHVYKIGGDVLPPDPIAQEQPKASATTKQVEPAKIEPAKKPLIGTVILAIAIGIDGRVHHVNIVRSLAPDLNQKAVEAVQKWQFSPARKNGLPVPVQTIVEVNFRP